MRITVLCLILAALAACTPTGPYVPSGGGSGGKGVSTPAPAPAMRPDEVEVPSDTPGGPPGWGTPDDASGNPDPVRT